MRQALRVKANEGDGVGEREEIPQKWIPGFAVDSRLQVRVRHEEGMERLCELVI
jgi:hypothetical protein